MWRGGDGIIAIYRRSKKKEDHFWNEWVSRPPAAVLVYALRHTRLTPNQITFLSLLVALSADAALLLWRTLPGLVVAVFLLQLAFIFDCVDGQLARIRGTASMVGGLLDFLMDEIKAVALVASVAGRLAWQSNERGDPEQAIRWLLIGLAGVVIVASGTSVTTFMRRPEYVALGSRPAAGGGPTRISPVGRVVRACEWVGRALVHYPQWLWLPAFCDRIDLFLLPYLAAHALYLGRASLMILWRLGR